MKYRGVQAKHNAKRARQALKVQALADKLAGKVTAKKSAPPLAFAGLSYEARQHMRSILRGEDATSASQCPCAECGALARR